MSDISNSNGNDKLARFREDGLDWMGSLPDSWDVVRLKYLVNLTKAKSSEYDAFIGLENVESWTGRYIPSPQSIHDDPEDDIDGEEDPATDTKDSDDEDEEQKELLEVKEGDVLFSKLRPYLAKCMISPIDAACSSEFLVFRDFKGDKRFLKYVMLSSNFINMVNSSTYGTKMPRSNWDFIKNLPFPKISTDRQQSIADYLDVNCTRLDEIITKCKLEISAIHEYKSALITTAVTKGLNESIYFNSGISWIGNIPSGWSVKRLKYICQERPEKLSNSTDPYYEFTYIDIGSVSIDNGIQNTERMIFINAPSRARKIVKKDDVIVSTVRPYLKAVASIEEDSDVIVSTGFGVFTPVYIDSVYFKFLLMSDYFTSSVSSRSCGVSYPATSMSEILDILVPVPPLDVQREIASHLLEMCSTLDNLIMKLNSRIDHIENYRKSIINSIFSSQME